MKQKIKVIGIDGKVKQCEFTIRNYDHVLACQNNRSSIIEDKRKKKPKYKHKDYDYE